MGGLWSCMKKPALEGWPAGNELDYSENGMKLVSVNDEKSQVIVVKSYGKFFGIGAQCTHLRAPLVKGFCEGGKVTCPWHGACFDLATGDIEDFPGIDGLPTYTVTQKENGELTVFCPSKLPENAVRSMEKCRNSKSTIVIIGGGPAGLIAAQTLRQNGFDGRIHMISKETYLPYDKTMLSKYKDLSMFGHELKNFTFFKTAGIDVSLLNEVVKIDFKNQAVFTDTKGDVPIKYDKLLIASGSHTPSLETVVEGGSLKNIRILNTYEEAMTLSTILRDTLKPQRGKKLSIVIIGGTLLGLEIAGLVASGESVNVIVIGSGEQPLDYLIGPAASELLLEAMNLAKNIFYLGSEEIKGFLGPRGEVTHVVTRGNGRIPCDMVILAMHPKPNTQFIDKGDGLNINPNTGAIIVDKHLRTSITNVYAAGDVTEFPFDNCSSPSGQASVQAWNVACTHGRVAALNMLGIKMTISNLIPFVWAKPVGICSFRIVGHLKGPADVTSFYKRQGVANEMNMKFCSLFFRNRKLIGCVTYDCDPIASRVAADLRAKRFWEGDTPTYVLDAFQPQPPPPGSPICRKDILEN